MAYQIPIADKEGFVHATLTITEGTKKVNSTNNKRGIDSLMSDEKELKTLILKYETIDIEGEAAAIETFIFEPKIHPYPKGQIRHKTKMVDVYNKFTMHCLQLGIVTLEELDDYKHGQKRLNQAEVKERFKRFKGRVKFQMVKNPDKKGTKFEQIKEPHPLTLSVIERFADENTD